MGMGDAESALALLNQKFPVADVIAGTKCERAIKWELTIGDDLTPHWNHSIVCVSIEKTPFAKGSCRTAHKLKDWSKPNLELVGKFSTNKKTTRDSYFTDVLMQAFCAKWAEKFNELKPPKPITFLPTYVYELIDHPPPYPVCGGEPFIEGEYKKHNNNSGYVNSEARNTPQAFSHFSFENSNHELLIIDIQGVNDFYTDPQIHTKNGQGFGEGNLGETGFHKFLQSHKCNAVCEFLKLKQINQSKKTLLRGTLPVVQLMEFHEAIGINQHGQPSGPGGPGGKPYDMAYFQSGNSNVPANLEDEERQLQEQLERIRAQQKAKQAAGVPKQPSLTNLKLAPGKPMPQSIAPGKPHPQSLHPSPATNNNNVTSASATPNQTSPAATSPQPVSPVASPKPISSQPTSKPLPAASAPVQQPPSQPQQVRPVSGQLQPATSPSPSPVQQEQPQQQPRASPPPQVATTAAVQTAPSTPAAAAPVAAAPSAPAAIQEIVPDKSAFEKWDLKSIRNVDTVRGLQSECIIGVDNRLFTGSNDGSIGVWDGEQMKHLNNIRAHGKSLRTITLSKSGNLVTGGADSYVKEWDINTMTCVKEIKEANEINSIYIQDNLLFTGCNDKTVKIWDMRSYECLQTLQGHTRAIKSVCALGNLVFSGSNDQQIFVWSLQTNRVLTNFQGHEGWVKSLYAHNNTLYSGSHDETVKVWDLKTTKCTATLKCKDRVETVYVTNQGIFAGAGDYLQVFDTATHENFASINTRSSILCLWRKQNQLFTGSLASNLKVWTWDNQN